MRSDIVINEVQRAKIVETRYERMTEYSITINTINRAKGQGNALVINTDSTIHKNHHYKHNSAL